MDCGKAMESVSHNFDKPQTLMLVKVTIVNRNPNSDSPFPKEIP